MAEGLDNFSVHPHTQERSKNRMQQLQNDSFHLTHQQSDAKHSSRKDQSISAAGNCPLASKIRFGKRDQKPDLEYGTDY